MEIENSTANVRFSVELKKFVGTKPQKTEKPSIVLYINGGKTPLEQQRNASSGLGTDIGQTDEENHYSDVPQKEELRTIPEARNRNFPDRKQRFMVLALELREKPRKFAAMSGIANSFMLMSFLQAVTDISFQCLTWNLP